MQQPVRIWDLPTRLFHWILAAAVIGLVITGKVAGAAIHWHAVLGHLVLALLAFRIVWGFVGGRWSRFSSFLYSPLTTIRYLRGQSRPEWEAGHNPLGAGSVFALLLVLLAQVFSGLVSDDEISFTGPLAKYVPGRVVSLATTWHRSWGQWLLLALVALHVAAILFYLWKKRTNLIRPMISGDKPLQEPVPPARDDAAIRLIALVIALAASVGAWLVYRQG